jgi:hypothetical protein
MGDDGSGTGAPWSSDVEVTWGCSDGGGRTGAPGVFGCVGIGWG